MRLPAPHPSEELVLRINAVSDARRVGIDQSGSPVDRTLYKPCKLSDFGWLLDVGLISVVLCIPFNCVVGGFGDEGVLLHGAERMLLGDRLYLDFFEFLPPGGFIIAEAWFGMAGISMLSACIMAILNSLFHLPRLPAGIATRNIVGIYCSRLDSPITGGLDPNEPSRVYHPVFQWWRPGLRSPASIIRGSGYEGRWQQG
jgi:hypothetical protein